MSQAATPTPEFGNAPVLAGVVRRLQRRSLLRGVLQALLAGLSAGLVLGCFVVLQGSALQQVGNLAACGLGAACVASLVWMHLPEAESWGPGAARANARLCDAALNWRGAFQTAWECEASGDHSQRELEQGNGLAAELLRQTRSRMAEPQVAAAVSAASSPWGSERLWVAPCLLGALLLGLEQSEFARSQAARPGVGVSSNSSGLAAGIRQRDSGSQSGEAAQVPQAPSDASQAGDLGSNPDVPDINGADPGLAQSEAGQESAQKPEGLASSAEAESATGSSAPEEGLADSKPSSAGEGLASTEQGSTIGAQIQGASAELRNSEPATAFSVTSPPRTSPSGSVPQLNSDDSQAEIAGETSGMESATAYLSASPWPDEYATVIARFLALRSASQVQTSDERSKQIE